MSDELVNVTDVSALVSRIQDVTELVGESTDDQLTVLFGNIKPLEKALKELTERSRAELIKRLDHAGQDDKGNRYFQAGNVGVRLNKRVSVKLNPDAATILERAGALKWFPREFDAGKARDLLAKAGIDEEQYTTPTVTSKTLDDALENLRVTPEVALSCVSGESITWAVTVVPVTKSVLDAVGSA